MVLKYLLSNQMKYMNENGFEVIMVSSGGKEWPDLLKNEGCPHKIVYMTRQITPFKDLVSLYRLYRLFKNEKPDIVHSHTPKAGLLAMLAAQAAVAMANLRWAQGLEAKVRERTAELAASNARTEQRAAELAVINSIQQGLAAELNFQAIIDLVGEKREHVDLAEVFVPIRHSDGQIMGIFAISSDVTRLMDKSRRQMLSSVQAQTFMLLVISVISYIFIIRESSELKLAYQKLETMATTDPLTGVSNRR